MVLKRKAQAITELAILGVIIIVAFSFLINYSEKLNRQQANIQDTFRAALTAAKNANNSASYTKKVYSRLPNVGAPMELGVLENFADSASVLWKNGKDRDDVYVYDPETGEWNLISRYARPGVAKYQFNNEIVDIPKPGNEYDSSGNLISPPLVAKGTEVTTDSFSNLVDATTTLSQNTGSGGISTNKTFVANDTLTAKVTIDGKVQTFIHTLREGGKYSSGNDGSIKSINR